MRKRIFKITAMMLALHFLLGSVGVLRASHTCFFLKKTDVSVYTGEGCCSKEKSLCTTAEMPAAPPCLDEELCNAELKKNCCVLDINYCKLDVSSALQLSVSKDIDTAPLLAVDIPGFISETSLQASHVFLYHSPSVAASGRQLLLQTGVLLI